MNQPERIRRRRGGIVGALLRRPAPPTPPVYSPVSHPAVGAAPPPADPPVEAPPPSDPAVETSTVARTQAVEPLTDDSERADEPARETTSRISEPAAPAIWLPFQTAADADPQRAQAVDQHEPEEWLPRESWAERNPELARSRSEAVAAYCRGFCDPEHAEASAALALQEFANAARADPVEDEHAANAELLRLTRAIAAEHPLHENLSPGWRERLRHSLSAERRADCQTAVRLLAARANDGISPAERDQLASHLSECQECYAVERRMLDAEQAFVTALETSATRPSHVATAPPVSDRSERRAQLVHEYCAAVCGSAVASEATREILEAFTAQTAAQGPADAEAADLQLIQIARAVAARHLAKLSTDADPGCVATPRLLAAGLNHLVDEHDLESLEAHLEGCERCRAVQARMIAAERIWDTTLQRPVGEVWQPADEGPTRVIPGATAALAAEAPPAASTDRRRMRAAFVVAPVLMAGVLLAIVLASGSGSGHPSASSPPKIAQQVAITSSSTTASTTTHPARRHAAAAHKAHRAARAKGNATAPATPPTVTTSPTTVAQATATTPQQQTPPSNSPPPSSPPPASPPPSSPPPSAPTTPTFTNPGSGVSATPAPERGLGGGGH